MGVSLIHVGNLAGCGLQELFQLSGPLFTKLRHSPSAKLLIYRFLVNALPHISSVLHGTCPQ